MYITLFCGHITWRNWNSHIHQNQSGTSYFRPFCSLCPEEIVIVLMANSPNFTHTLYENDHYKFLVSMHNLRLRLLGFHHWVQWRGAKAVSKECWGPCHGLIPSLDFRQNYSPQIQRQNQNWRGTITRFREGNWTVHFAKLMDLGLGSCPSCTGLCRDLSSVLAGQATLSAPHPLTWHKAIARVKGGEGWTQNGNMCQHIPA